jgi:hypothetical protein
MKMTPARIAVLAAGAVLVPALACAAGEPGAPGATTTIDGRYLPNPPPRFSGEIDPNAVDTKPASGSSVASFGSRRSRRVRTI